ncbi:MAG TPA: zf-TFIIB domain-containing protein [Anaerolineales bacterium]|nr:zf-TFIIB domain-containing protein [Anaerolineales bacterium]HMX75081.1 zf-TFIIB domain-containing protein [Anaerolineales bacterium]HMZ44101.1 zf-TFIIB domain-containing protein [Anaerolineales bacterium]HNB87927.1 zf-TFIIB domain-containing protein [Anaerolineales bacterium]HNC90220.1 zf-TFIIB domain-containing protein [Anaerolineales bacterium]
MNCPKCNTELAKKYYKGMIEVDSCPNCRGMWLDFNELDKLEDVAFDDDSRKGSLIHHQAKTEFPCPHCGAAMDEFQYRLHDLKLDYCAENDHGFWLDAGEDERVIAAMNQRAQDIQRKNSAESDWRQTLKDMHAFLRKWKP